MTEKILLIGQAPSVQPQTVPYDTTLLYEMLSWANISKEQAQNLFEFEALTDVFPGYAKRSGHKVPSSEAKALYWESTLKEKVANHQRIILLGRESQKYVEKMAPDKYHSKDTIYLIHPSIRNSGKIKEHKEIITELLKNFIYNETN